MARMTHATLKTLTEWADTHVHEGDSFSVNVVGDPGDGDHSEWEAYAQSGGKGGGFPYVIVDADGQVIGQGDS